MHAPPADPRIAHVWKDAVNPQAAYTIYRRAAARIPDLEDPARAVELFEGIDEALTLGVSSGYLLKLLALVEEWNDMCLIAEVSSTAYDRGMDPEYVSAVYLLDYAYDDWKTLSERLAEVYDAGVPAAYAAQVASRGLRVAEVVAAWQAGIAAEYVSATVGA